MFKTLSQKTNYMGFLKHTVQPQVDYVEKGGKTRGGRKESKKQRDRKGRNRGKRLAINQSLLEHRSYFCL